MTMLTANAMGIGAAAVYALLGYAVVFFGLILLMIVITIMGKFFTAKANKPAKAETAAPAAAPVAAAPAAPVAAPAAPGSAGPVKLYDTPPRPLP